MVLRVTKTYSRTSRAHNTLEFARLLFEVLVRFGPGECFGFSLSTVCDCVFSPCLCRAPRIFALLLLSSGFGFLRPADPVRGKLGLGKMNA